MGIDFERKNLAIKMDLIIYCLILILNCFGGKHHTNVDKYKYLHCVIGNFCQKCTIYACNIDVEREVNINLFNAFSHTKDQAIITM